MADDICEMTVAELRSRYRSRTLSPVEVTSSFLDRIDEFDPRVHAFVTVTREIALAQAAEAERRYATGDAEAPLLGVPVSVKDAFHVNGVATSLGSLLHRDQVAKTDSGVVRRLRAAGAVFTGKTNTSEFAQSATTDNLLGPDAANPWDLARTPGGSSGGAAASVAAGLSTMAVGSDGGGSIRIPAAFTGLYGLKPTPGLIADERGFRAMTDFVSPGPLSRTVADARTMVDVLADRTFCSESRPTGLRIGYCSHPEGRPVETRVTEVVEDATRALETLGHRVVETDLPIHDWNDIFGPLVLDDEHRERGHLLDRHADRITRYERATLRAAQSLDPAVAQRAHKRLVEFRNRIDALFTDYDVIVTPATAAPAFCLQQRPTVVDGRAVERLWGAFPFSVPFNVAGVPTASVPCGLIDGLPVGVQLVTRQHAETLLLDVSEQLESALAFDRSELARQWAPMRAES